jgi:Uncharacterized conserved protein
MKKKLNIHIVNANDFFKKLIGLSFKFNKLNYCMLFKNCNAIHTLFMFQSIDVIMMDKNNKVLYIKEKLSPLKIIFPKKNCRCTLELPLNTIKKLNIKINDIIEL